jgi:pilus assembly protein CpaF
VEPAQAKRLCLPRCWLVPQQERIVVVEDSRELAPNHPHVVRIEGRPANTELAGAISLTDLVRQSLRMRPDRLMVGEVRGAEICDLLTAMNTGHEGGCGTVHANSTADIPARVEALGSLGGLPRPHYTRSWRQPWMRSSM